MKTWEYRIIDSKDVPREGILMRKSRQALEGYLNQFGADGWELIDIDCFELEGRKNFVGIAKREKS
ncbi:MAG: hypothetical protein V1912_10885 [bacterium]